MIFRVCDVVAPNGAAYILPLAAFRGRRDHRYGRDRIDVKKSTADAGSVIIAAAERVLDQQRRPANDADAVARRVRRDEVELGIGDRPVGVECVDEYTGPVVKEYAVIDADVVELPLIALLFGRVAIVLVQVVGKDRRVEILECDILESEELALVRAMHFGHRVDRPFAGGLDAVGTDVVADRLAEKVGVSEKLDVSEGNKIRTAADAEYGLLIVAEANTGGAASHRHVGCRDGIISACADDRNTRGNGDTFERLVTRIAVCCPDNIIAVRKNKRPALAAGHDHYGVADRFGVIGRVGVGEFRRRPVDTAHRSKIFDVVKADLAARRRRPEVRLAVA